jgi:hypothetical protein
MKDRVRNFTITNENEKNLINGTSPLYQEIKEFNSDNLRKVA